MAKIMMTFEKALPFNIDFVIPGYEKSYPKGIFKSLAFTPRDSAEWHWEFVARL